MCVNDMPKTELDGAATGIEPTISNHKSNILTTMPPSHNYL